MLITELLDEEHKQLQESRLGAIISGGARIVAGWKRSRKIKHYASGYSETQQLTPALRAALRRDFPNDHPTAVHNEILAAVSKMNMASSRSARRRASAGRSSVNNAALVRTATVITERAGAVARTLSLFLIVLKEPIMFYHTNMTNATQYLTAKDPNERWTSDQWEAYHKQQWALLISRVATAIVVNGIVKKMVYFIPSKGARALGLGGNSSFARVITAISKTGSAPIRHSIVDQLVNNESTMTFFASLLMIELFNLPVITDMLGKPASVIENTILKSVEDARKKAENIPGTQSSQTPQSSQPSQSSQASQPSQAPQPKRPIDRYMPYRASDWEQVNQSYVRHIPSGSIFRAAELQRAIR